MMNSSREKMIAQERKMQREKKYTKVEYFCPICASKACDGFACEDCGWEVMDEIFSGECANCCPGCAGECGKE